MSKRKRNHWISQSYLRPFAIDPSAKKEARKVWVFRKTGGEPGLKPIENVAVKFYLYAPKISRERDYSAEVKLGGHEQLFGLPFWHHIATDFVDLRVPATRKGLALIVALSYLRNPKRLSQVAELHTRLVSAFSSDSTLPSTAVIIDGKSIELDHSDWPEFSQGGEDWLKRFWLSRIDGAHSLARIFLEMRWSIQVTDRPAFITSDDPVTAIHKDLKFRGFRNPGTSVLFPLSPTRVLHLDWRHDQEDGCYYQGEDLFPATNLLIWKNSIDCMLSGRPPDEVCAEMVEHADAQAA